MGLAIGLIVLFAVVLIIIAIIVAVNRKQFDDGLEENINKEIKQFLKEKNDSDYKFKSEEIETELKSRLKATMIDLRSNGYRYKKSYTNKTTSKEKEINTIIKKYYYLDKKGSKTD